QPTANRARRSPKKTLLSPPRSSAHRRRPMDKFHDRQHVRLRSGVHGTYLHANDDGRSVSLRRRRATLETAWTVHIYQGTYLLLHSAAYGRYLAATATRAPLALGHLGFRAELRDYDQPEVE
uniref:DUF569 domain-containing protein n=1 Tax=Aegilops tauschii subsp. strangulata TaxID=200361 RepID=A0A453QSJ8_AEGTS